MVTGGTSNNGIDSGEIHPFLHLLANVVALPEDLPERRHRLLEGLAELLGATSWGSNQDRLPSANGDDLGNTAACLLPGGPLQGPRLFAAHPSVGEQGSGIVFERPAGSKDFGERETYLVALILEEVPWIFDDQLQENLPSATGHDFTPRERAVLELLVEGRTRSEIAEKLSLSEHTISDYIKSLFQKTGVHSHSQLLGLVLSGRPFPINPQTTADE